MSQLSLIIKNEYLTDIRAKSFWITTFLMPVLMMVFGLVVGYLVSSSDTMTDLAGKVNPPVDENEMTPLKALGLVIGTFLTLFIMMYGSSIFQKVKAEKTNRIVEVLATCVPGKTMMLAKIISVSLIGFTQLLLWALLIGVFVTGLILVLAPTIPWEEIMQPQYFMSLIWGVLYFVGGYIFFGALFAAGGAMTDRNNENQEYVAVLTMMLLFSFYIGQFAIDHGETAFVRVLGFIPFTSPTVGAVDAITGSVPLWESLLSIIVLYLCAWGAMAMAGKIYTSSILLKGKKFSPKDIITFLRSK